MIARHVREKQIWANWRDVIRRAATIRSGDMTAADAVTALVATSRQSGLATALGESGRIERSIKSRGSDHFFPIHFRSRRAR